MYKISYDESSAYLDPPTSASAGDEVDIVCAMDILDAELVYYVDGNRTSVALDEKGNRVLRFVMPDHDITITYDIISDPYTGA